MTMALSSCNFSPNLCSNMISVMVILAGVFFTIFAWIFVGSIILGCLYWVVVGIIYCYHLIKEPFCTKNGKIDRENGSEKSYNVAY